MHQLNRRTGTEDWGVVLSPGAPDRLMHRGIVLFRAGFKVPGLKFLERAVQVQRDDALARENLGVALLELGKFDQALLQMHHSLASACDRPSVYIHYGSILRQINQRDNAIVSYRRYLFLDLSRADVVNALAVLLDESNQPDQAATLYCQAIALSPGDGEFLSNFSETLGGDNATSKQAIRWGRRAVDSEPTNPAVLFSHGCLLNKTRELSGARDAFERVLRILPNHAEARFNRALILLLCGELSEGWREYEWRWRTSALLSCGGRSEAALPLPSKESLRQSVLVLTHEQGLGDTIQFCRYGRLASAAGAKIVLVAPESLVRLLSAQPWISSVIKIGRSLPISDRSYPMMSLPLVFGTTLATIPYRTEPYLQPPADDVNRWRDHLQKEFGQRRFRVGLVWNGGFRADRPELWLVNQRRNVPLKLFAQALDLPGMDFISLQKGEPAESELRGQERDYWRVGRLLNASAQLGDFADTAGLIANLDLIVTVDTSVAHLAAALGKPTWILNRHDTCWRWFMDRDDSPWYASVKLYRQGPDRDWRPVLHRLASDLVKLAEQWGS